MHVNTTEALFATVLPACTAATKVAVSEVENPLVNSPLSTPPTVKVHVTVAAADQIAAALPDDCDVTVTVFPAMSAPLGLSVVANVMLVGVVPAPYVAGFKTTELLTRESAVVVQPVTLV